MLDNLPAHKVRGIRERIAAGARLPYLTAYSSASNPNDLVFAKLRAILCAKAAHTVSDLRDTTDKPSDASRRPNADAN